VVLAVFPDPVWAQAIRSRPAEIMGIPCFWTGVGFTYPDFFTFLFSDSQSPASSKVCE